MEEQLVDRLAARDVGDLRTHDLVRQVDAWTRRQGIGDVVGLDDDARDSPVPVPVPAAQPKRHADAEVPRIGQSPIDEHFARRARQCMSGNDEEPIERPVDEPIDLGRAGARHDRARAERRAPPAGR